MPATALYPFGHGLSCTDFALSDLHCDAQVDTAGVATIGVTVTSSGDVAGATVVQLYLRVTTSGVTRPAQQLAGFARVELEPGRSRRVTFDVASMQLGYTNAEGLFAVEPAAVDFFLGFASDDRRIAGSYIVAGAPRTLTSSE